MLRRLLSLGLVLAAPAGAQQRIDPGSWFNAIDVPREMMARVGSGGKVVMAIDVDKEGRPVHCGVVTTSGLNELDALTCALAMQRARWTPAHDAAGQAMPNVYRLPVDWRMMRTIGPTLALSPRADRLFDDEQTYQQMDMPLTGSVALAVGLAGDGAATRCSARPGGSSGSARFDAWLCRRVMLIKPFALTAGTAGPLNATVNVQWAISGSGASVTSAINAEPS